MVYIKGDKSRISFHINTFTAGFLTLTNRVLGNLNCHVEGKSHIFYSTYSSFTACSFHSGVHEQLGNSDYVHVPLKPKMQPLKL